MHGTLLLADLKGRRRFVPPLKSSADSGTNFAGSGNRNGTDSEAPRYTSEKKVCYILALMLILLSMYTVHIVCLENL